MALVVLGKEPKTLSQLGMQWTQVSLALFAAKLMLYVLLVWESVGSANPGRRQRFYKSFWNGLASVVTMTLWAALIAATILAIAWHWRIR